MAKLKDVSLVHNLSGKTALLRIDTDVDIVDGPPGARQGRILDDTRLLSSIPTIKFLLGKGADINVVGHLGRPNVKSRIKNQELSLRPVAEWFSKKLKSEDLRLKTIKIGNFDGWQIDDRINLLENIRFYKGEEENEEKFSRELSLLGDIYVNDAFAVSHRNHASIVGVTKFLPSYAGLHLKKEIEVLGEILKNPKRPLAVLIGGAKIETKLPLVEAMHQIADYVLVGGEIAEQDKVLIKVQHEKITGKKSAVLVSDSREDGCDITPHSVENFKQILREAKTIVWNGPVGVIRTQVQSSKFKVQSSDSEWGTRELAEFIVTTNAYKIVGGGDTLAYLRRLNLLDKFDFVSTGGGAMLEFLSGKKLPGLAPLAKT